MFHYALRYNANVEIIIYCLQKLDINLLNKLRYSGFKMACVYNSNIKILKYFIEEIRIIPSKIMFLNQQNASFLIKSNYSIFYFINKNYYECKKYLNLYLHSKRKKIIKKLILINNYMRY